jgi:hypothetical protein
MALHQKQSSLDAQQWRLFGTRRVHRNQIFRSCFEVSHTLPHKLSFVLKILTHIVAVDVLYSCHADVGVVRSQRDFPHVIHAHVVALTDGFGAHIDREQMIKTAKLLKETQTDHAELLGWQTGQVVHVEASQSVDFEGVQFRGFGLGEQPTEQFVGALEIVSQTLPQSVHLFYAEPASTNTSLQVSTRSFYSLESIGRHYGREDGRKEV